MQRLKKLSGYIWTVHYKTFTQSLMYTHAHTHTHSELAGGRERESTQKGVARVSTQRLVEDAVPLELVILSVRKDTGVCVH